MRKIAAVLAFVFMASCGGGSSSTGGLTWIGSWGLQSSNNMNVSENTSITLNPSTFYVVLGSDLSFDNLQCAFGGTWTGGNTGFFWIVNSSNCSNIQNGTVITGVYTLSSDGTILIITFTSSNFIASSWTAILITS